MAGAAIKIAILANAAQARSELSGVTSEAERMRGGFSRVGGLLKAGLFAAGAAGIAGLALATKSAVGDALSYEQAQKKAQAALKSADSTAGQSLATLKSRAASIETLTGAQQDENDVLNAQSRLLRAHISDSKNFDAATLASANVAAANGQSIDAASKVITKALADPTKATAVLKRSNIILTEAQQKQIDTAVKQGDTAKAQSLVLGEVNRQLGGQAAAQGKGVQAQWSNIIDTLQDAGRDLAVKVLPLIASALAALPGIIDKIKPVVSHIFDGFMATLPTIQAGIGVLVTLFGNPVFQAFAAGVAAIAAAMAAYSIAQSIATGVTTAYAAAQGVLNAVMAANPIAIIVLLIIGLVAALVVAYQRSETFREIVQTGWAAIQAAVSAAVSFIVAVATGLWSILTAGWNAAKAVGEAVWKAIQAVVSVVVAAITAYINAYRAVVVAVWDAIKAAATAVWNAIKAVVSLVLGGITAEINAYKAVASAIWSAISSAASTAWNAIKAVVSAAVATLVDKVGEIKSKITSALSGAGSLLVDAGRQVVQGLINGIQAMFGALAAKARELADSVKNAVSGALHIGSPSRVMVEIGRNVVRGLAVGMSDTATVQAASQKLSDAITSAVSPSLALDVTGSAAGAYSGSQTLRIDVTGTGSEADAGRQIVQALAAYTRLNGPARIEVAA